MPYLTQLAAVARRTGYPVTEVAGWQTRGHGPQPSVEGIVCHHTAGATGGGDYPSLGVVRDGRPGLDGPLSHFGLGRSGRIYVIAAGRCWHNAPSTSSHHTNSASLGIEAENDGRQPWPAAQLDAYKRLCAELCKEYGLSASRVKGHKEVNTQKPDPHSVSMADFRADVARLITGEDDMQLDDQVKFHDWIKKQWPKDAGLQDGAISVATALASGYAFSRMASENTGKLLPLVKALADRVGAPVDIDEDAIVAGILAGLSPDAIADKLATALPQDIGEQVAEALAARLAAGKE
ncbi:peptidoglycan recognition family protein [Actinomadura sp. NPDC049382]|uniref:peptidoglycan recognition protein family protein n=1 Tax=Actinomadura sp. NPDC049382 TaxID=3158220 RepID=UPI003417E950